jgi:hypothetical protein
MILNNPTLKPNTFAIRTSRHTNPKLQNSMSYLPCLKKKYDRTTSYIKHLAVSALSSGTARIKSSCKLTGKGGGTRGRCSIRKQIGIYFYITHSKYTVSNTCEEAKCREEGGLMQRGHCIK